ncbi:hypothetical protein ACP70R_002725 [Stipagrostis hirtigluma subsp. patula]
MVKAVVGDLRALEETLSSPPQAQVGLVVGKLSASSDRALVYSLLPTPPTDAGGAPACSLRPSSAAKPKAKAPDAPPSLHFDVDWVAEHARQVSRMLLGGMSVIGVYVWASEASFKATSPAILSQVIREVSYAWYGSAFGERLLLHVSYAPRRSAIVRAEPFKKVILRAINHLMDQVQNAKAVVDGDLFLGDMSISSEGPHQVDFLTPFMNAAPVEECSSEGVAGLLVFAGSISALAYLGPKESISEAISDLKADIIASLRSRLDIILDDANDDSTTTNGLEKSPSQKATQVIFHELREPYSFPFPRRVLIPWLGGTYICDYLQQSETMQDARERCKEVISLETVVENSSILEPEGAAATCATLQSFWDMVPGACSSAPASSGLKDGHHSGQKDESNRRQGGGGSFNILAALFALLVALIVGFVFTVTGSWKS